MKPNTDESEYITRNELADVLVSTIDQFQAESLWSRQPISVLRFARALAHRLRQPTTRTVALPATDVRSSEQIRVEIERLKDILELFPYEPWKGEAYNAAILNLRVSGYGKIEALKWTLREVLPGLDKEVRVIKSLDKPIKPIQEGS